MSNGGMMITRGKLKKLGKNPASVPFYPPKTHMKPSRIKSKAPRVKPESNFLCHGAALITITMLKTSKLSKNEI
jgi:hypothetical protein